MVEDTSALVGDELVDRRALVVAVLFAGGGGSSEGIKDALGVEVMVAINHDRNAIANHEANHPHTIHYEESVYTATAEDVAGRRVVDFLWASPDCKDFSNAKNGVPVSKEIRSLAWVIIDWIQDCRPPVICLENVKEFRKWGPVVGGKKDKLRSGYEFAEFVTCLGALGYDVDWKVLNAADYGAPTARHRLFLVARCDGVSASIWPKPTHGPGRANPWRTAAECIDWSLPMKSIFEREKPLAPATERRIAEGIRRYVLGKRRPFIVCLTHSGDRRPEDIDEPMRTITTAKRGERALVAPVFAKMHSHGWDANGSDVREFDRPAWTITAKDGSALVAAFLTRNNGTTEGKFHAGRPLDEPAGTVTSRDTHGLAAVFLDRTYGKSRGAPVEAPIGTITQVNHSALAAVFLDKLHGSARAGQPVDLPLPTITAGGEHGGGHAALVAAFLIRYQGRGGQWGGLDQPIHTVPTIARFGLVTVEIDGEEFVLTDIKTRMLDPEELKLGMGFRPGYKLVGNKAQKIARIGNAVCPPMAEAMTRALFPEQARRTA